jgi:hypothetical protein
LPQTPERVRYEGAIQATLGAAMAVTQGYASPDVERTHQRAFQGELEAGPASNGTVGRSFGSRAATVIGTAGRGVQ